MSTVKVVDASAIVAVMFGEPAGPGVTSLLRNAKLIAPNLLDIELANVCLVKIRRDEAQRNQFLALFASRGLFGVELVPVHSVEVLDLALSTGLSAYDASYLWLARSRNAELVTLDKKLAAASTP